MVGENADHIIAGDGSVDAAHSKSFVYIADILTSIHVDQARRKAIKTGRAN